MSEYIPSSQDGMTMMPTEQVETESGSIDVPVEPVLQCEHCGYEWSCMAETTRPTCPDCTSKTDRIVVRLQYHEYLKSAMNARPTETADDIADSLRGLASRFDIISESEFEMTQNHGDGHVFFEKEL